MVDSRRPPLSCCTDLRFKGRDLLAAEIDPMTFFRSLHHSLQWGRGLLAFRYRIKASKRKILGRSNLRIQPGPLSIIEWIPDAFKPETLEILNVCRRKIGDSKVE